MKCSWVEKAKNQKSKIIYQKLKFMLKNYFLIAIRSFKKDRTDTLISLSSLVLGLTCVMLIAGYIYFAANADRSYTNHNRIYRVIGTNTKFDAGKSETVPLPFAPTLVDEFPEIEDQTRITTFVTQALIKSQYADFSLSEVNNSFFSIFNFSFQQGNPATALSNPDNIVLTAATAQRLYGTTDVVGQPFITRDNTYIISAVLNDLPQNSFLSTDAFTYRPLNENYRKLDAGASGTYFMGNAFLLLHENASLPGINAKMAQFCRKYKLDNFKIELQPVTDIYLHSSDVKMQSSEYKLSDIKYVYIYTAIALLLLVVGCINFINLAIARNMERVSEMGIRKVMGAQKKQIAYQILMETLVYFLIAAILAFTLAAMCWQQFTLLSNISASLGFMLNRNTLLLVSGVCIAAWLLSGLYPAIFLANIFPVMALKQRSSNLKFGVNFRKLLITLQLTISVVLIVAAIVVNAQLHYLNNKSLGFNTDNLVSFNLPFLKDYPQAFKNDLLANPNIQSVTLSALNMGKSYSMYTSLKDPSDTTKLLDAAIINADLDFINTLGISVIEGRSFSGDFPGDIADYDSDDWTGANPDRPIIVSASLVKALQIENPIGAVLNKDFFLQGTIIGIFNEFSATNLRTKTPLAAIRCKSNGSYLPYVYARINGANTAGSLQFMSNIFKKHFPQERFDFSFVDERVAAQYQTEIRLTQLISMFTILSISLLGLGLFSLVSLIVRKRTKEIGIRKVLGASVNSIFVLIGKEFIVLILLALAAGIPLAHLAAIKWLEGYAYRTGVDWWFYGLSAFITVLVVSLSIGSRSVPAARANPVKALRSE